MSVRRSPNHQPVRPVALVGVVGALGYLGVSLVQAADPLLPADAGFAWRNILATVAALLLVGTVVGLSRSGAAGHGRAAGIGLVAVALGWVVIAAAQVASQLRGEDLTALFIAATVLHVLGMVAAGVAVVRAGVWTGWRRWVPLLCAVYLVAATPLFGLPGTPGHLAVAGWGACWLGLGLVLLGRPVSAALVQNGLLNRARLPVVGGEAARTVLDPSLPSNELVKEATT